jgi:hypothetical protein
MRAQGIPTLMRRNTMTKFLLLLAACLAANAAQAQIYSECKVLDVDEYYVAPHKDGFAAKSKKGFVYVTRNAVTPLFSDKIVDDKIVRMTGTADGKHVLFAGPQSISVVNVATKNVIKYELVTGVAHGRLVVLNGDAYGATAGELFKVNLQKKLITTQPFDANTHYWQGTWLVDGTPYIFATGHGAKSKEAAYAMPIDSKLALGEKVVNAAYTPGMTDSTIGQVPDDSGMLASYGQGQTWVVSLFDKKVVNKLPRYDYDNVTAYQGLVHARTKGGGSIDIYRFGSDSVAQKLSGVSHLLALSLKGNEMVVKMSDDSVRMFCK